MKTSDNITELAAALSKAQAEMHNAAFNKVNPAFKSKYADLASVRDAVIPALTKHGLSVIHLTSVGDNCIIVHTRMMHASGQWIESDFPITADTNKPQAVGSAYSYARRYSLAAICNIASEDDDDGNEATEHGRSPQEVRNITGTPGARKATASPDYAALVKELRKTINVDDLRNWSIQNRPRIDKLPSDWIEHIREDYENHKDSLTAKVAAE